MPAAFSLSGANNPWLTLLYVQQEKRGSLHHLSFLQVATSQPRAYNKPSNDGCFDRQRLRPCLSKLPARLGHLCSPGGSEISLASCGDARLRDPQSLPTLNIQATSAPGSLRMSQPLKVTFHAIE